MIQTAEKVIETVRALPEKERQKLFELIEVEKAKENNFDKNGDFEQRQERFKQAMRWIRKNREEYDGKWVALDGGTLLAHGTDGKKVHADAQAKGVKTPLMHRVSIKETQPFGGW